MAELEKENIREAEDKLVSKDYNGLIGITIPKNIGIGAILAIIVQIMGFVWVIAQFHSSVGGMNKELIKINTELSQIRATIYTRNEASIQFEGIRRDLDLLRKENERQDADIRDLKRTK